MLRATHDTIVARIANARESTYHRAMIRRFRARIGGDRTATVTTTRYTAAHPWATLVLAHGAGAGQRHPFMVHFARALAERDVDVFTFDLLYMERGRKPPDRNPALEACWQSVLSAVRARATDAPLFLGGKSMGGRIASQVAAQGDDAIGGSIAGLVFLGYPLHPPGNPAKLRADHLAKIRAPMLFCQGEHDAFGTPKELAPIAKKLARGTGIFVVDGGDHSFAVPKRLGVAQAEVYAKVIDRIVAWMTAINAR